MNGRLKKGVYNFEVKVFDRVYNREVVSTVTVTVQEIGDEPIISSGSLRLTGTCQNGFINILYVYLNHHSKMLWSKIMPACAERDSSAVERQTLNRQSPVSNLICYLIEVWAAPVHSAV